MDISLAISHILDTQTRNTAALANRYLDNAGKIFKDALELSGISDSDKFTFKNEIDRAHDKISELRAKAGRDETILLIANRLEAMGHFYRGELALCLDKAGEAIKHFEACLFVEKESAHAYFRLGQALLRAGKRDQAFEMLQAAIAIDGDNLDYLEYWDRVKDTSKLGAMLGTKAAEKTGEALVTGTVMAGKGMALLGGAMLRAMMKR